VWQPPRVLPRTQLLRISGLRKPAREVELESS
jgi:hypothetical protein